MPLAHGAQSPLDRGCACAPRRDARTGRGGRRGARAARRSEQPVRRRPEHAGGNRGHDRYDVQQFHLADASLNSPQFAAAFGLGGVATEVEAAYAAAVEASTREETWGRAVHRAKGWLVAVRDAIDLGTKDESALIEPLRTMLLARANQLQALMDTNMTRAELARLTGWENAAPPS